MTKTKSKTIPITQVTELAQKLREQLITSLPQGHLLPAKSA